MEKAAAEGPPDGVVTEVHPEAVADLVDHRAVQAVASLGVCPASGLVYIVAQISRLSGTGHVGLYDPILAEAFAEVKGEDANVFLDRSSFVTLSSFRAIAGEIAASAGCNLKKCDKVTSHQNRCVQIADYVAGAINRNYEDGDPHYMDVIREKVSIARMD